MKDYIILELNDNNKYIIIDMLDYENNINNNFYICIYDKDSDSFKEIKEEYVYNNIKDKFINRLEQTNKESKDIIKLKLTEINSNKYVFEKENNKNIVMDIEIFGNLKLEVNDYVYMLKDTTKEKITVRYGPIYTNNIELIKVVRDKEIYYLQRYYG